MASVSSPQAPPWVCSVKLTPKNAAVFKCLTRATSSSSSNPEPEKPPEEAQKPKLDPVKLAFEKAKAYKKTVQSGPDPIPKVVQNPFPESDRGLEMAKKLETNTGTNNEIPELETSNSNQELPDPIKLAMEKAKEYKKNKGVVGNDKDVEKRQLFSGLEKGNQKNSGNVSFENIASKKEDLTVSSIDFVGLGFADKKVSRGLPPGLLPISESYLDGDMPEVEIIVGDTSRFGSDTELNTKLVEEDESETYKPKVSTWGVFPRPSNISKTFGGGRVLRPGEELETKEDKAAKQKQTRELLAAYKKRTGLSIDPKLKLECEKTLEEGDSLMDKGRLKEALPLYEKVMDKLPFQSELYGLAALQWSICQDSLSRRNEARSMYEKLQSHPNVKVSKRAKQFLFGFQAMDMMKVKITSGSANTGYQNFFEAFIQEKSNYLSKKDEVEEGEGALGQAIPYIVFLVSPIFIVLLIAIRKGL